MKIYTGESIAEQITAFGIPCNFIEYTTAPQIITYYFNLKNILHLQKIKKITDNLTALTGLKVDYKPTNKAHFSLEIQRETRQNLNITAYAETMKKANPYSIIIGTDTEGKNNTATLDDLTHLLIAGTTGSGKSVCLNNIIISLLCYNKPQNLGLILIDIKQVEFNTYKNAPHLISPICTDTATAKAVLLALVDEMEKRYTILKELGKEKNNGEFKKIAVIIDELSDLILTDETLKTPIIRLLQKARACGIHLIIATQSPRAKILDGVMLANLPTRIALTCANVRESMLILGHKGAEQLTGKGDALYKTQSTTNEKRVQIPYISKEQIKKLLNN